MQTCEQILDALTSCQCRLLPVRLEVPVDGS